MHEWALAEGVIHTALQTARDNGLKKVTCLRVTVGQLQQIVPDLFCRALQEAMPEGEPLLEDMAVDLQTEEACCRCRACGGSFGIEEALAALGHEAAEAVHFVPELAHSYLFCPACGSPDYEVLKGRGVWLAAVEGQR